MARSPEPAAQARRRKSATVAILVLHGPNLNLLGTREPGIYGADTLASINARLVARAKARGVVLATFQSNHEGALIDRVHAAGREGVRYIVINPAGFTHTSVALRDAIAGVAVPFLEVHLSNVHAREPERRHLVLASAAVGVICGLGAYGYEAALRALVQRLRA